VSLVHGSWTTGASVHHGPASIADQRSSSELGLGPLRAMAACHDCTGRMRSSSVFGLGPHPRRRGGVVTGQQRRRGDSGGARVRREEVWGEMRCGMGCSTGPFIGPWEGCRGDEGGVTASGVVASMDE
jgi:hypothetical protein